MYNNVVMGKFQIVVLTVLCVWAGSDVALADEHGNTVVEWKDVRKFIDIQAGSGNQLRFEQWVCRQLGDHLRDESAKYLKEGQRLLVTVHNLDLAGEIRMNVLGHGGNVRVVREPAFVMIDLEYKIVDAAYKELLSGRDQIRKSSFPEIRHHTLKYPRLTHEKRIISDWLKFKLKSRIDGLSQDL